MDQGYPCKNRNIAWYLLVWPFFGQRESAKSVICYNRYCIFVYFVWYASLKKDFVSRMKQSQGLSGQDPLLAQVWGHLVKGMLWLRWPENWRQGTIPQSYVKMISLHLAFHKFLALLLLLTFNCYYMKTPNLWIFRGNKHQTLRTTR